MKKMLAPLRATLATRLLYSLALLSVILLVLVAGSGWVGLAMGGGLVSAVGPMIFQVVVALLLFRIYQVLRYPAALDSRSPNVFGWLLRYTGLLVLAVEVAAGLGILFMRPLTHVIFGGGGENGIAYFAVGLVIAIVARYSWLGVPVFELSRFCGKKIPSEIRSVNWSRRGQDAAVLGILLAAVLALPSIYQAVIGPPCGERNLAACVSAVDGEVERMIGLPHGEPVSLETDVKEIVMYSGTGEKRREVLIESPIISLEAAGHPVSITSDTAVRVRLDAKEEGGRVSLALVVMKEGAVASRFDIQFAEGATIEKIDSGGIRIAAKVSGNAKPGMRTMHKGPKGSTGRQYYAIDQIFILLRRAIGSEVEAQEWVSHITRNARRINGSSSGHAPYSDGRSKGPIDKACNEFVEAKPAQAVAFEGNDFGWPLWGVTFMGSTDPGPHALLSHRDYLTCNDQEVWIVSYAIRRPDLQIRRYTHDGHLLRFVDTTVPAIKRGAREYEVIDPSSVHEDNGHLYFDRVIMTTKENISREKRRESYALDL